MAINMQEMRDKLLKNATRMTSTSDMRSKKQYVEKIKWEMNKDYYCAAPTIIEFPFNPFDFDDETYDDRNTFKIAMLPELFIKSLGRELYHSNERFKKFINEQFTKLSDDVKLVQGLKTLEIPEDTNAALTPSEIATYCSLEALYTINDNFRNVKSKNGKYTNKTIDMTKYVETEDGYLEPLEETMMVTLGTIETALANKNKEIYTKFVNSDPTWINKKQDDKDDFVNNMSWGACIIGPVVKRAILPVFWFQRSDKNKTKFEDTKFDYEDIKSFHNSLSYIIDKDFISSLKGAIGAPEHRNVNYITYRINFKFDGDTTNKDKAMLDAYKGKEIAAHPELRLEQMYPKFPEFFASMWDETKFAEEALEGKEWRVPSFLTDYIRRNCRLFIPRTDEYLSNLYTSLRQARDFQEKFGRDEIDAITPYLEKAGISVELIASSSDIIDVIVKENQKDIKQLTQLPSNLDGGIDIGDAIGSEDIEINI